MIVNNTIQSTIPVAKSTVYTLPSWELIPQISLITMLLSGKNIKGLITCMYIASTNYFSTTLANLIKKYKSRRLIMTGELV